MTVTKIIYVIQNFDQQFKLNYYQLEAILKELDVEYANEQESKQSNNKHHVKEGFKSFNLIYFDAATKICKSISEETKLLKYIKVNSKHLIYDRKCL